MTPSFITLTPSEIDSRNKNTAKLFSVLCDAVEILRSANQKNQTWKARTIAVQKEGKPTGGYEIHIIIDPPV